MKSSKVIAMSVFCIALVGKVISQSSTIFQYDTKGNQTSAIYTGTNPCPMNLVAPPSDGIEEAESPVDRSSTSQASSTSPATDSKEKAALSVNPNPVSNQVTIRYFIPEDGEVSVGLFSTSGRVIAEVSRGWHQAGWHERSHSMGALEAGTYFCRLSLAGESVSVSIIKH